MIVGGIVRISDSGLGCGPEGAGTEGWPLCGGRVVPLIDTNMIIEYSHRILAGALTTVIFALAYLARRRYRGNGRLVRLTTAAFGLVLFQAALGGLTVEKGLEEELVAAHLTIAMLQVALLIAIAGLTISRGRATAAKADHRPASLRGSRAVRALAVSATAAVLATIAAGGYMSASELHGTSARGPEVHSACGTDFPSCAGEFMPFGRSREVDIHLTHRAFMYLASALVLAFAATVFWLRRRRPGTIEPELAVAAGVSVVVLVVQVLLGALNVWVGEREWLIVAHLTVGTLLWCSLVAATLAALRTHEPVGSRAPADVNVQAVPA